MCIQVVLRLSIPPVCLSIPPVCHVKHSVSQCVYTGSLASVCASSLSIHLHLVSSGVSQETVCIPKRLARECVHTPKRLLAVRQS